MLVGQTVFEIWYLSCNFLEIFVKKQTWRVITQRVRVRPAACDATLIGFVHLPAIYLAVFDTPYLELAHGTWNLPLLIGDLSIN